MVIASWNRTDNLRSLDFSLDGPFHGAGGGRVFPGEQLFSRLRFQATHNITTADAAAIPGTDGLLQGLLTLRSGRERGAIPVLFLTAKEGGITHYQYDFDRDGAPEWVLRVIACALLSHRRMEAALWHSWTNQQTTTSSRQAAPCMTFWFRRRLFPQTSPRWEISHPTAPTVPRGSKKNRERACNFRTANMRILPRAFTSKKPCGSARLKQSRPPTASRWARRPPPVRG